MFFHRLGSEVVNFNEKTRRGIKRRQLAALGLAVAMTQPAGFLKMALGQTAPVMAVEVGAALDLAPTDETLRNALDQYKNGQFEEAQATLGQVQTDTLSSSDKTAYKDLSSKLDTAVAQRKQARENFEKGEQSLAAGNIGEALNYYRAAFQNRYADEGTRNKAAEQIALAEAAQRNAAADAKTYYDTAVEQYKKGDWIAARENFNKAAQLGFKPGLFQESPQGYLAKMNAKEKADAEKAARGNQSSEAPKTSEPAVITETKVPQAPTPAQQAKSAYDQGVKEFRAGDFAAAKNDLNTAAELGYKPGLFEDAPQKYLTRIADKEKAALAPVAQKNDAEQKAREEAQERDAQAHAAYDRGQKEYRSGDWNAARKDLNTAAELGYKPGLFQEGPKVTLAKMDAKEKADQERAAADAQAKIKAEADAKAKAEAQAKAAEQAKQESEARAKAQADAQAKAAEQAKQEAEARAKADADRKAAADAQAKADAEKQALAQAQHKAELEAQAKVDAEKRAQAEAQHKADLEAQAKADAAKRTQAEAQAKAEADRQAKAKEEAQAKAAAELQAKAAQEAQREAAAQRAKDARQAYLAAKAEYQKGDWISARRDFTKAQDMGYKPGLFEDSAAKYLSRMDSKEQADAMRKTQAKSAVAAAPVTAPMSSVSLAPAPVAPAAPAKAATPVAPAAPAAPVAVVQATPPAPVAPATPPPAAVAPAVPPAPTPAQIELQQTAQVERIRAQQNAFAAQELVNRAITADSEHRYADALDLYTQATNLDPSNQVAQAGLAKMLALTGKTAQPSPLLERQDALIRARRQAILYNFDAAVGEARQAITATNFTVAQAALERARIARATDPGLFTQDELARFDTTLADVSTSLDRARETSAKIEKEKSAAETALQEHGRITQALAERERTVAGLIRNARQLIEETKYEEALKVLDQILAIDPNNDYAGAVRPLVEDRALFQQQRKYREDFDREMTKHLNNAEEKRIPYEDLIRYPANWPDIVEIRDQGAAADRGEKAVDQQVAMLLEKKLPEIRFDAAPFADVVEFMRDVSGANIYVNYKALETAGIDRAAPVTARLRDVKFDTALRKVLDDVGGGTVKLDYTVEDGVITISTAEDLSKNVVTRVYDIRDLLADVPDFTQSQNIQLSQGGGGGHTLGGQGGGGGGGGQQGIGQSLFGQGQDQNSSGQGRNTRADRVDSILKLVTDTVAPESWRDAGGTVGAIRDFQQQQLIVTQTPENHRQVAGLLEKLRETRAIQISIETRFLSVQRNFLDDVGFDADFVFNLNNSWSNNFSPIVVTQGSSAFTQGISTGVTGGLNPSTPALNVSGSFLDDFSVNFLIRATQASQSSSLITAPRLTLFNGQYAQLFIGTEIAYVSDLQPVVGTNTSAFAPTINTIPSGVQLLVQGTVSADRKYVTLTLQPRLATLVSLTPFTFQTTAGTAAGTPPPNTTVVNTGPGNTTVTGTIQIPISEVETVSTTVSVPDGGTLLLGGQTAAGEAEREMGVPGLSKIPFLKRLFTNRSTAKDERIILILVKPTIIIQREAEQRQFPLLSTKVAG